MASDHRIHRVPGVRGANAYLLTDGPLTLIDSGLPGSARAVLDFMAALGYAPRDLKRILLTHRHPDHAGGSLALREATGAAVHAHISEIDASGLLKGTLRETLLPVDQVIEGGMTLEGGIGVIHCGGHTAGSVCYFLGNSKALFLGDMAINNVDRLSRPLSFSNEDQEQYEAALANLVELDVDAGYFGHGPPLLGGLRAALLGLRDRPRTPAWLGMLRLASMRLRGRRRRD